MENPPPEPEPGSQIIRSKSTEKPLRTQTSRCARNAADPGHCSHEPDAENAPSVQEAPRTATPRCAVPAPHRHPGAFLRAHPRSRRMGYRAPRRHAPGGGVSGARRPRKAPQRPAATPGLQGRPGRVRQPGARRPRGSRHAPPPASRGYATLPRPRCRRRPPPPPAQLRTKRARRGRGPGRAGGSRHVGGGDRDGWGPRTKERAPAPGPARRARARRARPAGGAEGHRPRTMRPAPAGRAHLSPGHCCVGCPLPSQPTPVPHSSPAGRRGRRPQAPRVRRGLLALPPAQPEPDGASPPPLLAAAAARPPAATAHAHCGRRTATAAPPE